MNAYNRWAILWDSGGPLDGLVGQPETGMTRLFRTRREAREYKELHFGYIRYREDLKKAPHWWKVPKVVKVTVKVTVVREKPLVL